ncbi:hypothetical protein QE390_003112 [Siphonobacter sp. SORGH_AS 1065]|nr:hypothetical protein [Siphonobacter sp. SORGH_AS_1065]
MVRQTALVDLTLCWTNGLAYMATIREVVVDRFSELEVELSAVKVETLLTDSDLNGDATYSKDRKRDIDLIIAQYIPVLLNRADVTEGGYSVKYDRDSLLTYYGYLCAQLEIENVFTAAPVVQDRSNLW